MMIHYRYSSYLHLDLAKITRNRKINKLWDFPTLVPCFRLLWLFVADALWPYKETFHSEDGGSLLWGLIVWIELSNKELFSTFLLSPWELLLLLSKILLFWKVWKTSRIVQNIRKAIMTISMNFIFVVYLNCYHVFYIRTCCSLTGYFCWGTCVLVYNPKTHKTYINEYLYSINFHTFFNLFHL